MMQSQKYLKKLLSLAVTGALVASVSVSALADDITAEQEQTQTYTYQAPTSPMEIDDNIITASAHRAASPALGMLGLNAVSGYGMINGQAPTNLAEAESSAALGIWGSSLNANPDPYYWNYFYNYYAQENGLALASDVLINPATGGSGGPQTADQALLEEYGNLSVSIHTRPDILLGVASQSGGGGTGNGYDAQIAAINALTPDSPYYRAGDEDYSPKQVNYQTTFLKDMIVSIKDLAAAANEVAAATGKTTRYGDPMQIAQDYEDYIYGIVSYVRQQLEATGTPEKTVAVLTAINEDGTYTIANAQSTSATSMNRAYEYAESVTKSLSDTYGTIVTLEQLQTADVIITINNQNISQATLLESFGANSYNGILITNTPSSLYGVTMNSVENANGFAFIIGCIYSDVLDIDPVELCAYFYQHFLHIDNLDSLATVVQTNFASVILPEGVDATLPATYSEAAIKAKLDAGLAYWKANPAKFIGAEYEKLGMGVLYTDVSERDTYYDAIKYVTSNGLFQGNGDGTFAPTVTMNRAMLATVLYNLAGKPEVSGTTPFTDLTASWYQNAVTWCYQNNVMTGTTDTAFSPDAIATEETIVTILYRYAKDQGLDVSASADLGGYSDAASVSSWALEAMQWAAANSLLDGVVSGSSLTPDAQAQRCTVAQFMMNYSSWAASLNQDQAQSGGRQ